MQTHQKHVQTIICSSRYRGFIRINFKMLLLLKNFHFPFMMKLCYSICFFFFFFLINPLMLPIRCFTELSSAGRINFNVQRILYEISIYAGRLLQDLRMFCINNSVRILKMHLTFFLKQILKILMIDKSLCSPS